MRYTEKMADKSAEELRYLIDNAGQFHEEAVMAAKQELEKREAPDQGEPELDISRRPTGEVAERENADIDVAEHPGEQLFPPKPVPEIKTQSIVKSIMSIALFIVVFYLVFNWEFVYILILAGIILVHELGHYLAMRTFNYKDLNIFFVPLIGAFASGSKDNISQKQSVIIFMAGPVPGVFIGLIFYYLGLQNESELFIRTANIFILLNLFNLLPIMPLDGGRIVKSLFFESKELINKIFLYISIAVFAFIALYSESYFLLIIPVFLLLQLGSLSQVNKVKKAVKAKGIDLNKSYDELSDEDYWLIRDELAIHMKYFSRIISPGKHGISPEENRIMNQIKGVIQKKPIKDLKTGGKIMVIILWALTFIIPFAAIAAYYLVSGMELV